MASNSHHPPATTSERRQSAIEGCD